MPKPQIPNPKSQPSTPNRQSFRTTEARRTRKPNKVSLRGLRISVVRYPDLYLEFGISSLSRGAGEAIEFARIENANTMAIRKRQDTAADESARRTAHRLRRQTEIIGDVRTRHRYH